MITITLKKIPKWAEALTVALLLLGGIYLRSYRLTAPLGDWHSWRQADTAAVARNFATEKFDLLYPQADSLWILNEKLLPNPNRYFINEFPLYNAVVAVIYQWFGVNHVYGRMVSIAVSSVGALALYAIVRRLLGYQYALASLLLYQTLPYNIYYNRVVMPDPSFVAMSIISLYFALRYADSKKIIDGVFLSIFFALATLIKPYAIFIAIPIIYWLLVQNGPKFLFSIKTILLGIASLIPLTLWRYHIHLHPEGAFASKWLLNGDNIRFTGAFFRWIIFDRFNRLIFATGGFALFVYSFFVSYAKKNTAFFFVWTLSILLYITVFAKGNVNHDYYQLPIVAPGVVMIVIASGAVISQAKTKLLKLIHFVGVSTLLLLTIAFGWFEVRGYFNINNEAMITAGARADAILPKDAVVIVPYMGDPAFLYQVNRNGWPVGGNIDERIRDGATHYVTTSFDQEYQDLKTKYTLVEQTDLYGIIKLSK